MNFPDRLQEVMDEKGYTKYRISRELKISASTIANYLSSKTRPDPTKVEVLSRLFGVTRTWLLDGEGEKYRKEGTSFVGCLGASSVHEDDNTMTSRLMAVVEQQAISLRLKDEQLVKSMGTNELLLEKFLPLLDVLIKKF